MPRRARGLGRLAAVVDGRRMAGQIAARLGQVIRQARIRRRWSQRELGAKVGLTRWRVGQIERGRGAGVPAATWCAFSVALDVPFKLEFGRDSREEPADGVRALTDPNAPVPDEAGLVWTDLHATRLFARRSGAS